MSVYHSVISSPSSLGAVACHQVAPQQTCLELITISATRAACRYTFALLSCVLQASYLILVERSGAERGVGTTELLYYNAILSLPFLFVVRLLPRQQRHLWESNPAIGDWDRPRCFLAAAVRSCGGRAKG